MKLEDLLRHMLRTPAELHAAAHRFENPQGAHSSPRKSYAWRSCLAQILRSGLIVWLLLLPLYLASAYFSALFHENRVGWMPYIQSPARLAEGGVWFVLLVLSSGAVIRRWSWRRMLLLSLVILTFSILVISNHPPILRSQPAITLQ
jgi:hypothetical protein